jgi:hypothetical protein
MMNQLDTTQRINSQNMCSFIYSQKKTEIYLMAMLIAKHRARVRIMNSTEPKPK